MYVTFFRRYAVYVVYGIVNVKSILQARYPVPRLVLRSPSPAGNLLRSPIQDPRVALADQRPELLHAHRHGRATAASHGFVEGSKVRRRAKSVSNASRAPKSAHTLPKAPRSIF